jgi:hypothetical protein
MEKLIIWDMNAELDIRWSVSLCNAPIETFMAVVENDNTCSKKASTFMSLDMARRWAITNYEKELMAKSFDNDMYMIVDDL